MNLTSCKSTSTTVKVESPPTVQWGKVGEVPTNVYTNYDWIIMSQDRYLK